MPSRMYYFDLLTKEYKGARPAQYRPNGEPVLEAVGATPVAPPERVPAGHAVRFDGMTWEVVEDHRQRLDARGVKQGGTAYWLPAEGDDYTSPARYMEELGPLPKGAVTTRPARPAPTAAELAAMVRAERARRLAACDYLVMPDYPLMDAERARWLAYRQALRDLPQQEGFPWNGPDDSACPWPHEPKEKLLL